MLEPNKKTLSVICFRGGFLFLRVQSKSGIKHAIPIHVAALLAEDWLLAQRNVSDADRTV